MAQVTRRHRDKVAAFINGHYPDMIDSETSRQVFEDWLENGNPHPELSKYAPDIMALFVATLEIES